MGTGFYIILCFFAAIYCVPLIHFGLILLDDITNRFDEFTDEQIRQKLSWNYFTWGEIGHCPVKLLSNNNEEV